jgi:hypothetical protein
LYDASHPKGKYYFDLWTQQQVDIICSGNHELYKANSSNDELRKTVPAYKDSYLASNLDIIDPERGTRGPLAQRFKIFETKNQKLRVLAFGFLFDFTGNDNNTIVQPVEETVKEKWFHDALSDRDVDLIVVIGHVGIRMNEFKVVYTAIRDAQWDTPLAFFGGHVHVRDFATYDKNAAAIASGRYLETIGFLSMDGIKKKETPQAPADLASASKAQVKYERRYIDTNLVSYHHHSGTNETTFDTPAGRNVTKYIAKARRALRLDRRLGCAPETLYVNRAPYPSNSSLFSWLADRVLPAELARAPRAAKEGRKALVVTNTGAVRFDVFKGPFTTDTGLIVSPFTSGFRFVADVPAKVALRVLALLNSKGPMMDGSRAGLESWMMAPPEQMPGGLAGGSLGLARPVAARVGGQVPMMGGLSDEGLRPGYTTVDDHGEDGDDTEHERIEFFTVPNCVQAPIGFAIPEAEELVPEDEVVDLVYNEFVEPWILLALEYLGLKVDANSTAVYIEGETLTTVMESWVRKNWKC